MPTNTIKSIEPLRDGLIVKRDETQQTTSSGIVIPGSAQEAPQWGTVIKAGPGKKNSDGKEIALFVKEGDKVLFGQYAGTKFKYDGVEYLFMREEDVLGVQKH
jgi:chaperonin GroES